MDVQLNRTVINQAFQTGKSVVFTYHNKVRTGKIERIRGDVVTMPQPEGYKSFIVGRIQNQVRIG